MILLICNFYRSSYCTVTFNRINSQTEEICYELKLDEDEPELWHISTIHLLYNDNSEKLFFLTLMFYIYSCDQESRKFPTNKQ